MKEASLSYVGRSLLMAFVALIVTQILAFNLMFIDRLLPVSLPLETEFEDRIFKRFRRHKGNWIGTAGELYQHDETIADSLTVIPIAFQAGSPYYIRTSVRFVRGQSKASVLFNMNDRKTLSRSQMVRTEQLENGMTVIVSGYLKENGEFLVQRTTLLDLSLVAVVLAIQIKENAYSVFINGDEVAGDVPLMYLGGEVGLGTIYSSVAFDSLTINMGDLPPEETIEPVLTRPIKTLQDTFESDTLTSIWIPFSGAWEIRDGALSQSQMKGSDFIAHSVDSYEDYTFTVYLRHEGIAGGGIVFHMPSSDSRAGAHIARFFPDNRIAWGYFDARGKFQGLGDKLIFPPRDETQVLSVQIRNDRFNLILNGETVAKDIPLQSAGGHVGFTTTESLVRFLQAEIEYTR